jgi:hypothetical protein
MACSSSPLLGSCSRQKTVRHAGHRHLALAHADGFDDDDVVARRFHQAHHLTGVRGHPAQGAAAGAGADEGRLVERQLLHARLVTEDGAARNRTAGIDGQHGDAMAQADQVQTEALDEAALARTGHTREAEPDGLSAVRQRSRQQRIGQRAVRRKAAFQQGDGLGQPAAGGQLAQHQAAPRALRMCLSTSRALSGIGVPGP